MTHRRRRRPPRVLAISDEAPLLKLLRRTLTKDGLEVLAVSVATWRNAAEAAPVAIVLDMAAFSLKALRELRLAFPSSALLVHYGDLHPIEVADVIDFGAEALARPFRESELRLRLRAARRRATAQAGLSGRTRLGDLSLDPLKQTVFLGGCPLELSPAENAVLVRLLRGNTSVSCSTLLTALGHTDTPLDRQYVHFLVFRIRRRIRHEGFEIVNEPNFGYRLTAADPGAKPTAMEGHAR